MRRSQHTGAHTPQQQKLLAFFRPYQEGLFARRARLRPWGLPRVLKNILAVIKHIEFMGRHHAPKANPFSGLFVMELEAELATLEKTLTA